MCTADSGIKVDGAGGQMSRVVGLTAAAAESVAHIEVALVWSEDMARQGQCSRVSCGIPVYLNAIDSLDIYCPLRARLSLVGRLNAEPARPRR